MEFQLTLYPQILVLEIIGQRLAQRSTDGMILFDSRILFDSKPFIPQTLTGLCKAEGCDGPTTVGITRLLINVWQQVSVPLKVLDVTFYATKDLDVGTRFEYNGDRIDSARLKPEVRECCATQYFNNY